MDAQATPPAADGAPTPPGPPGPLVAAGLEGDTPSLPNRGGALGPPYACALCRFDLTGLPNTTRCPECGTPVEWLLRGDLLRVIGAARIDRLRRGAGLLVLSYIALWPLLLLGPLSIVPVALAILGWWRLTTPLAQPIHSYRISIARPLVRIIVIPTGAATVLAACVAAAMVLGPVDDRLLRWTPSDRVLIAIGSTLGGLWLLKLGVTTAYLSGLARRSGDPRIHSHGTGIWIGAILLVAAVVVGVPASLLFGVAFAFPPLCAYWPIVIVGALGWAIGYLSLFHVLRQRFEALVHEESAAAAST